MDIKSRAEARLEALEKRILEERANAVRLRDEFEDGTETAAMAGLHEAHAFQLGLSCGYQYAVHVLHSLCEEFISEYADPVDYLE